MNILFVCTGNTCRSPMAQGLMDKIAKEKGGYLKAKSAGIFAFDGQRVTREAVEALKEEGIDISDHRANIIHRDLLEEADLILTMTVSHKHALLSKFRFAEGKVYTLKEYAYSKEDDIQDPYGRGLEAYRIARDEIKAALIKAIDDGQLTIDN